MTGGWGFILGLVVCIVLGCFVDWVRGTYRDLSTIRRTSRVRDALRRIR